MHPSPPSPIPSLPHHLPPPSPPALTPSTHVLHPPPPPPTSFQVDSIAHASPATITRCGIVYMDRAADVWQPTIASWAAALEGPLVDYANKMQVGGGDGAGLLKFTSFTKLAMVNEVQAERDGGCRLQGLHMGQLTIASWAVALKGPLVDYANKMQVGGLGLCL